VLALGAALVIEIEDEESEDIPGLYRAALAAIRPQLSGAIAEAADRTGFNACSSSPAPSTASKPASRGAARGR